MFSHAPHTRSPVPSSLHTQSCHSIPHTLILLVTPLPTHSVFRPPLYFPIYQHQLHFLLVPSAPRTPISSPSIPPWVCSPSFSLFPRCLPSCLSSVISLRSYQSTLSSDLPRLPPPANKRQYFQVLHPGDLLMPLLMRNNWRGRVGRYLWCGDDAESPGKLCAREGGAGRLPPAVLW